MSKDNIIRFPNSKGITVEHDNITVISSDDEMSVGINDTSLKVLYWDNDMVSLVFDESHEVFLPRDIFQRWVSAIDLVGDIDNDNQWSPGEDFPTVEWCNE